MNRRGVVAAVLVLTGCAGGNDDDLQAWMQKEAQRMRGGVKPLPELRVFPVVDYAGALGDDPFRAARIMPPRRTASTVAGPDLNRRKEPLEAIPLESLRMVGVLMRDNTRHALIRADNTLHQVKVGNYMGQNFGLVTSISESEVSLRELVEDAFGDWVERTTTLLLQERQEAGR